VIIRDQHLTIWPFLHDIVAAGDTCSWAPDTSEEDARAMWLKQPPGRTIVAPDNDGTVLGTAETHPNQPVGGPAAHVANAGFLVDPAHSGRGVGRALAEHVLEQARADGYRAMAFNAVVETNTGAVALWRSLGFEIVATLPEGFQPSRPRICGSAHHVPTVVTYARSVTPTTAAVASGP
jgi:ribosomal protein S18 acetylase RimI-like enzyme